MIKPTVGRVIWFFLNLAHFKEVQPYAATIAHVNEDGTINVGYLNAVGHQSFATNVPIVEEGQEITDAGQPFCMWMPYQKGQAAKTEELEKKLEGSNG